MPGIMAAADLHIVSLRDSPLSSITMPGKVQSTLALGKPFIAILSGDAREASSQSGSAILATPGDPESIAHGLRMALSMGKENLSDMGLRGVDHYKNRYAVELGVDKIEALLTKAVRK
jgi:glycosyltransferase involved in cell wall biosynthesis